MVSTAAGWEGSGEAPRAGSSATGAAPMERDWTGAGRPDEAAAGDCPCALCGEPRARRARPLGSTTGLARRLAHVCENLWLPAQRGQPAVSGVPSALAAVAATEPAPAAVPVASSGSVGISDARSFVAASACSGESAVAAHATPPASSAHGRHPDVSMQAASRR